MVQPLGFRFKGPLYKKFTTKIFSGFVNHLLERANALSEPPPAAPGFSIRILQFVLPKELYDELLKEAGELVVKYVKLSRLQMAVQKPEDLETVSFMIGIDRVDAIANTFGELF